MYVFVIRVLFQENGFLIQKAFLLFPNTKSLFPHPDAALGKLGLFNFYFEGNVWECGIRFFEIRSFSFVHASIAQPFTAGIKKPTPPSNHRIDLVNSTEKFELAKI